MVLLISTALLDAIRAEACARAPEECCGLLTGDAAALHVTGLLPARNVAADPRQRFEIDPAVLLAAHRAARAGGPAIIGHYHSHPGGSASPSAVDAAMAQASGEIWLVVGRDLSTTAWRAVRDGSLHGCFEPVEMTVPPYPHLAPVTGQGH